MDPTVQLALFLALVLGVNLMPAFGPPTWTIIVFYALNTDLHPAELVLTGALAAASGRYLLASAFRLLGARVSARTRRNLAAARAAFERNRTGGILALGLFALSPLPSAQLFEAAGLARVRLIGFTLAFFLGRVAAYSIYAFSAHGLKQSALGDVLAAGMTSPWGIALQLAMIAGLVALAKLDWEKLLGRDKE